MNILKNDDIPANRLRGMRIAVLGFGAQGTAHAHNLRDGGYDVIVGLRPGRPSWSRATAAGFSTLTVPEAVTQTDVVMMLLPDEQQPAIFAEHVGPNLRTGAYLGFAHGFAIHYRRIVPHAATNVFLAAPNGVGALVRRQFVAGQGVPCMVAVHHDPAGDTRDVALAYAAALGAGRAAILETTFREETESDLFAEQAVLCGGLTTLIRAGYETLVDAGYAPEIAYLSCVHEVKLLADLVHERGLAGMTAAISSTARYGELTRGPRVIGAETREAMRRLLDEIRSGAFADEWTREHASGAARLRELTSAAAAHAIEDVGRRLRALMPWLSPEGPADEVEPHDGTVKGSGAAAVPTLARTGAGKAALPAERRGTGVAGRTGPCCIEAREAATPAAADGEGVAGEPSHPEWPGFDAPPDWFMHNGEDANK